MVEELIELLEMSVPTDGEVEVERVGNVVEIKHDTAPIRIEINIKEQDFLACLSLSALDYNKNSDVEEIEDCIRHERKIISYIQEIFNSGEIKPEVDCEIDMCGFPVYHISVRGSLLKVDRIKKIIISMCDSLDEFSEIEEDDASLLKGMTNFPEIAEFYKKAQSDLLEKISK